MSRVEPILSEVPAPGDDGYAYLDHDGTERVGWHVHTGARLRWARPEWAQGKLLIHVKGGTALEDGFEEEGCAFLIDLVSLRELGEQLARIALQEFYATLPPHRLGWIPPSEPGNVG